MKKREYNQRVIEIEHGTFTPLVIGTNGGIGGEFSMFLRNLAEKISSKQGEKYSHVMC